MCILHVFCDRRFLCVVFVCTLVLCASFFVSFCTVMLCTVFVLSVFDCYVSAMRFFLFLFVLCVSDVYSLCLVYYQLCYVRFFCVVCFCL